MKVSVVIATRNTASFLKECVKSLLRERGENFEIIVVDDASTDNTKLLVTPYLDRENVFYYTLKMHKGAAYARNFGASKSTGVYLFFVDADTVVSPGWSTGIVQFFDKNKRAGAGQVKLIRKNTNRFDSAGELISHLGFLVERAGYSIDRGQFDKEEYIFSGKSAGMVVRSELFRKIRGFDEDYVIFLEDTDLCWRVWLAGYRVYFFPSVVVHHAYGTKEKDMQYYVDNKVVRRGCANVIATLIKNLSMYRLIILLPIHVAVRIVLSVGFLAQGNLYRSSELLLGLVDAFCKLPTTIKKRQVVQGSRKLSDSELFTAVGAVVGFGFYFRKARSYLTEKAY